MIVFVLIIIVYDAIFPGTLLFIVRMMAWKWDFIVLYGERRGVQAFGELK
jgi:hypothetical protein